MNINTNAARMVDIDWEAAFKEECLSDDEIKKIVMAATNQMHTANTFINTSVDDARSSLACRMMTDPLYVVLSCGHTLVELQGRIGQKSRRQMLAGMIRKALKEVPMEVVNDQ